VYEAGRPFFCFSVLKVLKLTPPLYRHLMKFPPTFRSATTPLAIVSEKICSHHMNQKLLYPRYRSLNMCCWLTMYIVRGGDDAEDNFHYFYVCPLFICQRILLFTQLRDLADFLSIDVLLKGSHDLSFDDNVLIMNSVHTFICGTKRLDY
jgi:hypothetical protein